VISGRYVNTDRFRDVNESIPPQKLVEAIDDAPHQSWTLIDKPCIQLQHRGAQSDLSIGVFRVCDAA
jgi:hypothetical protein